MALAHGNVRGTLEKHGYTELRTIGEGSFGKAILVQAKDGSRAVCKMIDVSKASATETRNAAKEGQLLASLKYPYIVRYRENFTDNGWFCILMDYCKGGDLSQQILQAKKTRTPIGEEQVLRWFSQAMLALKYIHDRHILHRDLKPGNFFLSKTNGSVKMGDFGIAKVLSCTVACARTQIGTPYYLSPEVCQEKPYDWSSDIWAMGCLLFELCASKVPFDAPSISGLVQKICKGPIPSPPSTYSPFLRELCGQMLNRNPRLRPSADEVLKKPQIQAIVRQMLDDAQSDKPEVKPAERPQSAAEKASPCPPAVVAVPPPASPPIGGEGPAEGRGVGGVAPGGVVGGGAGGGNGAVGYKQGDKVEYFSSTHNDWLAAVVLKVEGWGGGSIVIDLKPNTWMSREMQAQKIRRRRPICKEKERPKRPPSRAADARRLRAPVGGA